MRKVAIVGGGGVRTPLLVYGLAQSEAALGVTELVLFDVDVERMEAIARLSREVARKLGASFSISTSIRLEEAAAGADFVLNSIRVGGMAARARDERSAISHGLAGQETTGPGGAAMALRTLPVVLDYAKTIQAAAPEAWLINFTNPAGLITQALIQNTKMKVLGICDTPSELFHRIAAALREPLSDLQFDYAGLNHLGWVRRIFLRKADITAAVLKDAALLRKIYPAELFDPALLQTLRLIPTEYLFFYYSKVRAYGNQVRAGATRGEELEKLNGMLFSQLQSEDGPRALDTYTEYLKRRNASYMKLEAQAGSAFSDPNGEGNPFEAQTGYHRIALDVMNALTSPNTQEIVVNAANDAAIDDLPPSDVVEVPCRIDRRGVRPRRTGVLPEAVLGLVQAVKAYERTVIKAALSRSKALACLALLENPSVGDWETAVGVLRTICESDPEYLGYLQ